MGYQALLLLVVAQVLEILAKYGIKFSAEYMHAVLLDDVGAMPIMALTLLTPGLHPGVRILALAPAFLTAMLSFSQICKHHSRLPGWLRDFLCPLVGDEGTRPGLQGTWAPGSGLGLDYGPGHFRRPRGALPRPLLLELHGHEIHDEQLDTGHLQIHRRHVESRAGEHSCRQESVVLPQAEHVQLRRPRSEKEGFDVYNPLTAVSLAALICYACNVTAPDSQDCSVHGGDTFAKK